MTEMIQAERSISSLGTSYPLTVLAYLPIVRLRPATSHATPRSAKIQRRGEGPASGVRHPLPYSITLSARANNASGTVTPIALAVLRLITSSNFMAARLGYRQV